MSVIKDISLSPSGADKINWVRSYMPVLNSIEKEFRSSLPFRGMRISVSIHLEAKTAYLARALASGGASVAVTGCNPLSTQDDVAAALAAEGFEVFARHGASPEEYEEHLALALAHKPHLIIDDGGDFTALLHGRLKALASELAGGCEETTTGVTRLMARHHAGKLSFPMINVNGAECKHLFDNRYGTGQSTLDGIMHTTNLSVAGRCVVVAGYGWCGKGIAMRAKGMGASVIVTEINPVKAIEAKMDGFEVMTMTGAAPLGDLFITATGCGDVITGKHASMMKNGALLCNSGHFDVEINIEELERGAVRVWERKPNITGYEYSDGRILNLLARGRLVNLAAGNGHPAEIMDMSFSLQAKCLEHLAKNGRGMAPGVYDVPAEIDRTVAELKLTSMGVAIDRLTPAQREYMVSYGR